MLGITKRQLQAKFKHAADFGVQGNWSNAAGNKFNSVINQHINSKGVKDINGTHRGNNVMHYVNPKTGLNVISTPSGNVISGWKLNSSQLKNVINRGSL
ncbi:colicin D domain-containing protein [Bergeyella zoohelcum]